MQNTSLFSKLLDAAKGLSKETHRLKKDVKKDFSLMNAEAYLDKVVHEIENFTPTAVPGELAPPWTAEDGFVYSAAGLRVADCHCDEQPETEEHEETLAQLIAAAVNASPFPVIVDTSPPPKIAEGYGTSFNTMLRAAAGGNLALVSARYNDGRPAVLVCAMQTNPDKTITPVPFAIMVDGNPFEMFQDPTADVQ
jgi:hypothetical protein